MKFSLIALVATVSAIQITNRAGRSVQQATLMANALINKCDSAVNKDGKVSFEEAVKCKVIPDNKEYKDGFKKVAGADGLVSKDELAVFL